MKKPNHTASVLRGMTKDGSARFLVIDSTEIVNEAIRLHGLSPTASAALGRLLSATSMIGTLLAQKTDTLTIGFHTDGTLGKMIAVSDYRGNVKGYVENPLADPPRKPNGKLDVGTALGTGTLFVARDLKGAPPQVGTIAITNAEIAQDLAEYFAKSEQIPTLISLGVLVGREGVCLGAGGVLVQLLPFADETTVDRLERNAADLSDLSRRFADGMSTQEIAQIALRDIPFDVFDTLTVSLRCDCSRERMRKKILSLGQEKVRQLLEEEEADTGKRSLRAVCHFCHRSYSFTEQDLLGSPT